MSTLSPAAEPVGVRRTQLWPRTVAVARMHFADLVTLVLIPAAILASIFVINIVVWQFVPESGRQTGGAASIYCFLAGVAALAVTRALPFALGMGSSRRAFLLGTLGTGIVLSIGWAVALFVLQRLERATGGWGKHGNFFWFSWFADASWASVLLFAVTSLAASFVLGALIGACWVRWNRLLLLVAGPLLVLVGGGLLVLVSAQHWWGDVGRWLGDQTPLSTAGWCALLTVALAALLHPVLRRVRG